MTTTTITQLPSGGNLANGDIIPVVRSLGGILTDMQTTASLIPTTAQLQKLFWASPSGASGFPTYRAITAADLPTITVAGFTSGTITGVTINNSNIGQTTPALGSFIAPLYVGTPGYSATGKLAQITGSSNSYQQMMIQNTYTAGAVASSDVVVNNDLSTDSTYYGDFGINSSGFTGSGAYNAPNTVYVSSTSCDLAIGTTTANPIHFFVASGTSDAMTIATTGVVTIQNLNSAGVVHTSTAGVLSTALVGTADITAASVTLAKIQNASASSKILGSGASGSGASYSELTLGTGLSMSGTTLNATGGTSVAGLSRSNLKGVWASNTTATWTANQLLVQNGSQVPVLLTSYSQTLNSATSGAGGLDTGTLATSTWYAVYAIYNPTTPATSILMSASFTSPTLPSGYTYYALIGAVVTDGSKNFIGFTQSDRDWFYKIGSNLASSQTLICSGAQGSISTPTYVAQSISGFAPTTIATKLRINLVCWSASSTTIVSPNSSWPADTSNQTSGMPYLTTTNGAPSIQGEIPLESSNIYYAATSTYNSVYALGFTMNL